MNIENEKELISSKYIITENGQIISKETGKIRKTEIAKNGYERVSLWFNGICKKYTVHRLVALFYIDNSYNLPQINHKDGNKLNNNVNNLEWCDNCYNMQHAYKNNLIKSKTKKVNQYDLQKNFIKQWDSITEIEKELKINHSNIVIVCQNKTSRKQAGGYIWKYVEENENE